MKIIKYITFLSIAALISVLLMNCKKDEKGPSISAAESEAISKLVGTWTIQSVTQDGEDPQIGDYSSLQVTFNGNSNDGSGKTYSVTNGAPAFPDVSNATWTFLGVNFDVIQRQDGFAMRIVSNTASQLVLQQDVTEELGAIPGGRVAYIGEYIYTFTK